MGFSHNQLITLNTERLYQKGDILLCPLCKVEHYLVKEDIFKKDHVRAGQVETVDERIINPAINVSQRCQFCFGGQTVPLVEKVAGKQFR